MEIMDPYTAELLSAPPCPGDFSGRAAANQMEFDDDFLRSIGALPPRPSADTAPASVEFEYPPTLEPSSLVLLPSCDLLAAALGAHVVKPAVEVPVPSTHQEVRTKRPAPDSEVAAPESSAKRPRISCPWVPDYDADIDFNLREKERNERQRPSPDYLETVQGDRMDERTRSNLVIWMDEFTKEYHLFPGTLHRAVSYVDRVLSLRTLTDTDSELRLLGAAAIFTAAKYEASSAALHLNASDVAEYCGFATGKEVTDMEREMLAALRYELSAPTAFTFVEHFTRHSRGERHNKIRLLAHQLADTSLLDYRCLRFMPSAVAATAMFIARLRLDPEVDNHQYIEDLTGYKTVDLFEGIYSLFITNPNSRFVVRRYPRALII
jgi:cyclin A|nr:putative cyclin-F2-1 [Lolium perenne]